MVKLWQWYDCLAKPDNLMKKVGGVDFSLDKDKARKASVIVDKDGNVSLNMHSDAFKAAFQRHLDKLKDLDNHDNQ